MYQGNVVWRFHVTYTFSHSLSRVAVQSLTLCLCSEEETHVRGNVHLHQYSQQLRQLPCNIQRNGETYKKTATAAAADRRPLLTSWDLRGEEEEEGGRGEGEGDGRDTGAMFPSCKGFSEPEVSGEEAKEA